GPAGLLSGGREIASGVPDRPAVRVAVVGRSGSELRVTPSSLDFGEVLVGRSKTLRLLVANRSAGGLTLTGIQTSDRQFVFETGFSALPPDGSGNVEVRFAPLASGEVRGQLVLTFDGPQGETAA